MTRSTEIQSIIFNNLKQIQNMNNDEAEEIEKQATNLLSSAFENKNHREKKFIEQMLQKCFELLAIEYSTDNLKRVKSIKRFENKNIIEDFYLDHKTSTEKLICSLQTEDTFAGIYKGCSGTIHIKQ